MTLYELAVAPFADYGFMRRAVTACAAIAVGGAPLGVFLVLRRMALAGDALSHAILPGAAIAFFLFGMSIPAMALGGLGAGLAIALITGSLTRFTDMKEDASLTATYLLSLAFGALLIALKGSAVDLMHVLFGNVLAIDAPSLLAVCAIASASALMLAALYRCLLVESFDPDFLRAAGRASAWMPALFLGLLVMNLVAAFQALGTLMALGLIVLPAIAARFWTRNADWAVLLSVAVSFVSSVTGLLVSYHCNVPSGPAIVLTAGGFYVFSLILGPHGGLLVHFMPRRHFAS